MVKKTITYEDYAGIERTEDFYFNFSKAEAIDMESSVTGGLSEMLKKMVASKDTPTMMRTFKDMILKSYGERSEDGKRFIKSPELSAGFAQTEAFSTLYVELLSDENAMKEFFEGIMPKADKPAIPAPAAK